jgi:hypothetical protein
MNCKRLRTCQHYEIIDPINATKHQLRKRGKRERKRERERERERVFTHLFELNCKVTTPCTVICMPLCEKELSASMTITPERTSPGE